MRFSSLTHHLVLWFIVVALVPLLLFGYLSLAQNEAALRSETQARMSRLADKKTIEIKVYLAERAQNAQMLARSPLAMQAMDALSRAYAQHGPGSAAYLRAELPFRKHFSAYIDESALFYDVFLITPQGDIVYTYKREADFATNLFDGPFRDSQLAGAFRESSLTFESSFSGFETYTPSGAPAAFVTAPILHDGAFLGVLAFQLSTENIYRVALDASGLGATGETLLARLVNADEALFVAPLRHDPQAAMQRRIDMKTAIIPMRHALLGGHGSGIETDYSGRQVVAAWQYVPELRWGMVVKIDADEAFAPVYRERRILLQILLALILLAGAAALYFGRRLVVPLKGFAQTADAVARGDLDRRVAESGLGEIGALGHAFNRMTANLQSLYRTLEDRVEERTRELNVSNEQLQEEIVERELIEAALRENEELLTSVMKLLPVGVWILNGDGKIIFENTAGRKIWGGAHDLGVGRIGEQKGWWLGNNEPIEPHEWASARAIGRGETSIEEEIEIECLDGTHKIILNSALPLRRSDGSISGAVVVNQDITERKQAEELLQRSEHSLKEAQRIAHLGNWDLDLARDVLTWSDEIYRIFEIDPERFGASYEAFLNVIHPDDRELVNNAYTASVESRMPYDIVHRLQMKDGRVKYVNEIGETYYSADGEPLRSFGIVHDITERKQAEAQIAESMALLQATNKALDEFTYIAAHDLKEPLRGIHNYTSFLKEDYGDRLDGEAQQYINSIQRLAERLSALIDRLLAYSRLGSSELARDTVDIDAVVDAVAEDLSRLWMDAAHGGMGIELRRNGPLGTAQGDATRIGEVFQNLISNAAKYSDKPSKWIEVGCDRSGPVPVFYVRDNGIGIQPHHQETVFRIFKRLHEQNKYGGGTGAGLTITKKIIELHGGRIWLDSVPGEGTTFYFTLSEDA
jgi:PAS domain S-box-containing protein